MNRKVCLRGYTLIELIIVVAILSILLAMATPAFSTWTDKSQRSVIVHDLLGFFAVARQEAIMRGQQITLCPLDTNNSCVNDWHRPIYLFADPFNQRRLTDPNQLVRVFSMEMKGNLTASKAYFRYGPDGLIQGDWGNLTWCPDSGDARQAAHLVVNRGGRLRVAADTDGDGIPNKANGDPVQC